MKARLYRWFPVLLVSFALTALSVGCGGNTDNNSNAFTCEPSKDGWQICKDNKVQYCHTDHMHWGADCQAQGLTCVTHGENKASCVDESTSCDAGASKCEANAAYNCVNGKWAVEKCGTAKECEAHDNEAHCHSKEGPACGGNGELHDGKCECKKGYKVDPDNSKNCIAE